MSSIVTEGMVTGVEHEKRCCGGGGGGGGPLRTDRTTKKMTAITALRHWGWITRPSNMGVCQHDTAIGLPFYISPLLRIFFSPAATATTDGHHPRVR